jgi:4,5-DOPA dioxygenase extradiol
MEELNKLNLLLESSPRMPVLFVGHGNPMNAILDNDITREWSRVGKNLPKPQAIVVISAHWLTEGTRVTDAPKQPLIYDMYGFPDELYKVKYEAQGSLEVAQVLQKQLLQYEAMLDSTWGLDHGTWSVLKHLAPSPKAPVLQISLDVRQTKGQLVQMFQMLRPLRDKGVVFIGSGNIVHNLRAVNWHDNTPYDWAIEFDELTAKAMTEHDLDKLVNPVKISNAVTAAVPTDDHYRPMLAAMSLLYEDEQLAYFNDMIEMGSVGMRSFISSR